MEILLEILLELIKAVFYLGGVAITNHRGERITALWGLVATLLVGCAIGVVLYFM